MLNELGYGPLRGVDYKDGKPGKNGRSIELRNNGSHVQWKYIDDTNWVNLISLSDIKGKDGKNGRDGMNGRDGRKGLDSQKLIHYGALITIDGGRADSIYTDDQIIGGGGA